MARAHGHEIGAAALELPQQRRHPRLVAAHEHHLEQLRIRPAHIVVDQTGQGLEVALRPGRRERIDHRDPARGFVDRSEQHLHLQRLREPGQQIHLLLCRLEGAHLLALDTAHRTDTAIDTSGRVVARPHHRRQRQREPGEPRAHPLDGLAGQAVCPERRIQSLRLFGGQSARQRFVIRRHAALTHQPLGARHTDRR